MGSKLSPCAQYALTQLNDEPILGCFLCTWMSVISHTINYSLLVLFTAQRWAKTIPNTPTKQRNCNNWSKAALPSRPQSCAARRAVIAIHPSSLSLSPLLFHPAVCLSLPYLKCLFIPFSPILDQGAEEKKLLFFFSQVFEHKFSWCFICDWPTVGTIADINQWLQEENFFARVFTSGEVRP